MVVAYSYYIGDQAQLCFIIHMFQFARGCVYPGFFVGRCNNINKIVLCTTNFY